MTRQPQIKPPFVRALLITGLILPAIFPSSGRALTQEASIDANAAVRGGAVGSVSQIRRTTERLAPFAGILPPGTPFLPSYLVNTTDTSIWNHPSSDPAGIAYWPLTGQLLISDTEIEEAPQPYWDGFNVYQSTLAGSPSGNCTTFTSSPVDVVPPLDYNDFSEEPSGMSINNSNNRIYFSDDVLKKIFEVNIGTDNTYCTSDDIITSVLIGNAPFNINDPEDLAYASGKLYIASGMNAEVYEFDLGVNGVLGGGDDSSSTLTHFDTASLGFGDLEGIAYNSTNGTLFLLSTSDGDVYLGETSTSGTLQRAYDLSYLGHVRRSGLTVAPASGNPSVNNIYIVSRGLDNDSYPDDYNDGKIWEISLSGSDPADLIFKDGFESGNFSAWTSSSTNGGNLSVSPSAALFDSYGMRAVISNTSSMYITDDDPTLESRYRARFYFDPNSIAMGTDVHSILQGNQYDPYTDNYSTVVFQVQFRYSGEYQIRGRILPDSGILQNTSWYTITDAPHYIEVDWSAATADGANNGYLTLWVDDIQKENKIGIDNDTRRVDRARLGSISGPAVASGTYYFDAFESRRQSYIGRIVPPTVVSVLRADANPTGAATVNYTVTFSESVTGVNAPDFTLTTTGVSGASINGVSGSGTTYTVAVNTGAGDGTIRLDVLDDNSIIDIDSNSLDNGFTSGEVYAIEKDAPSVISVTRANSNPTNAATVDFTVTFSEVVTGVDLSDFTLTTTSVSGMGITGVSGTGSVYTVTVNTGSGDGTIRLDVLDDNSIVNTANNPLTSGFTTGEVYIVIKSAPFADVQVNIAGSNVGTYNIAPQYSVRPSYAGLNNGPVSVLSTNAVPIVASERVAYSPDGGTTWTSYSELMGLPSNQLTTSYTFPWYNNLDLNSQLRFGNVGTSPTTVTVTIGGMFKGNYNLAPNASTRISYPGLDKGPVKVTSSGNVPIIASMRVAYFNGSDWTSFSEMMGLPSPKLTNSYVFPWYNNIDLNSQLRFGNVGTVTTTVTVTVGGVFKGNYTLGPNTSTRVSYPGLDKGPVKVTSSGNVPIIASMRVAYFNGTAWSDFSEMMGMPSSSLSTHYSFPVYDNVLHNSQLRFGNVGTANTTVTVTINGVLKGTYNLAPNASQRISYASLDAGPVVIQSSGNVPIIASERVAYFDGSAWSSFAEMMGLPQSQLTTTYLFPWYNNIDIDTQLRFGVP